MPGPGIPSPGRRTCSHSTTFAVLNPNVQLQPCMSAFMPGKNVNKHQKGGASFERGGGRSAWYILVEAEGESHC